MKLKHILVAAGILSAVYMPLATASLLTSNPKIDKFVQMQYQTNHPNKTIFVILKDTADLSGASAIASRDERIRYVYDTLRNKALATQGPLLDYLQNQKVSFRQFYIENMIEVENASAELVNSLAARADVARIMGNPLVKLKLPAKKSLLQASTTDATGPEPNLVRMGATRVWEQDHVFGDGIVIAGQDTGVQWDHPALKRQYRGYSEKSGKVNHDYNWHDAIHKPLDSSNKSSCGYDTQAPCDDYGHGTHTIGTVVGDDGKGNQIGVAPKAQWMACKNMDNGVGTPASYIECFEYFLAPYPFKGNPMKDGDPTKAPHIINNSWGCTKEEGCVGDEILPSLTAMKKAGILVVASAGNEGPSCSSIDAPPAWHTGLTLSVGAFDHVTDKVAFFSSRGPSQFDQGVGPNVSAPGVGIRSSVPGSRYQGGWSGTSMAGPHAVGAAALLWSFNKDLIGDIDTTIAKLEQNAEPKTSSENCGGISGTRIPNNTYGYGLLNAYTALHGK